MPEIVIFQGKKTWRSTVEVVNAGKVVKVWTAYGADSIQALEAAVTLYQYEWPTFKDHNGGKWEVVIPTEPEALPGCSGLR
jgi:hypothetical protein